MATIIAPSGREYQWNKDTDPTPEDIAYIKQKDAELSQEQPAQHEQVAQEPSVSTQPSPIADISGQYEKFKADVSRMGTIPASVMSFMQSGINKLSSEKLPTSLPELGQLAARATSATNEALPEIARITPTLAAGFITKRGTPALTQIAETTGPAAAIGEIMGQGVEMMQGKRKEFDLKGGIGRAVKMAVPSVGGAIKQASIGLAMQNLGDVVETGKLSSTGTNAIVGTIGAVGGMANRLSDKIGENVFNADVKRRMLQEAGIDPTAIPSQYLFPNSSKQISLKATVAGSKEAIQDAAFHTQILNQAVGNVGDLVEGGVIAKELGSYVNKFNAAEAKLAALSKETASAQLGVKAAEDALDAANQSRSATAVANAMNELENANNALNTIHANEINRAATALRLGVDPAGNVFTPDQAKKLYTNLAASIDAFSDRTASAMYGKSALGFGSNKRFIPTDEIAKTIKSIKKGVNEMNIDILSDIPEGVEQLSLNEVRQIRKDISDLAYSAKVNGDRRAASLLGNLDNKVKQVARNSVAGLGDESLQAYDKANAWYSSVLNARQNPLGRSILGETVKDEAVFSMVKNLVNGKSDEYSSAIKYIDSVANGNKEVQSAMKSRLNQIVRDSVISTNTIRNNLNDPVLNVKSLLSDLRKVSDNKNIRFSELGFGDRKQLNRINESFAKYDVNSISQSEFDAFMRKPTIKNAIANGYNADKEIAAAAAEVAAKRAIYDAAFLNATNEKNELSKALTKAQKLFNDAGIAETDARLIQAKVNSNPIINQIKNGRSFGMAEGTEQDFGDFISFMTDPNRGTNRSKADFFRALDKENPTLRDAIRNRYLNDKLAVLVEGSDNPMLKRKISYQKAESLFDPLNKDPANERVIAKIIMGSDNYDRFEKLAPVFRIMAGAERKLGGGIAGREAAQIAGATRAATTGKTSGFFGVERMKDAIYDLVNNNMVRVSGFLFRNPDAFEVYKATGSIQKAIGSVGSQTLARELAADKLLGEEVDKALQQEKSPQ
jgi:hypothetical protein